MCKCAYIKKKIDGKIILIFLYNCYSKKDPVEAEAEGTLLI